MIFIGIVSLVITGTNMVYKKVVLEKTQLYRQSQQYNNENLDYAFFGDSMTRNAINPEFIDNSFNFASSGEDYGRIYYRLRKMVLDDDIKIKTAVLQINDNIFLRQKANEKETLRQAWFWKDYMKYWELSYLTNQGIIKTFLYANFPFLGKGDDFAILYANEKLPYMYKGWVRDNRDIQAPLETYGTDYDTFYFGMTMRLLVDNDINIVHIRYPEYLSNEPNDELRYRINYSYTNQTLDYQDLLKDSEEYFADNSTHLNYNGSVLFTNRIRNDVI